METEKLVTIEMARPGPNPRKLEKRTELNGSYSDDLGRCLLSVKGRAIFLCRDRKCGSLVLSTGAFASELGSEME